MNDTLKRTALTAALALAGAGSAQAAFFDQIASGNLMPSTGTCATAVTHSYPITLSMNPLENKFYVQAESDKWVGTSRFPLNITAKWTVGGTVRSQASWQMGYNKMPWDLTSATNAGQSGTIQLVVADSACMSNAVPYRVEVKTYEEPSRNLTGTVTTPAGAPVANAMVYLEEANGTPITNTTTNAEGKYALKVNQGTYRIGINQGSVAGFYYGGHPRIKSPTFTVKHNSTNATRNFTVGTPPTLTQMAASSGTLADKSIKNGAMLYFYGSNFGDTKGYIDFGSYHTNSSVVIQSWSDTLITAATPQSAVLGNCWRIFSKVGGYSNCAVDGGTVPEAPAAPSTATDTGTATATTSAAPTATTTATASAATATSTATPVTTWSTGTYSDNANLSQVLTIPGATTLIVTVTGRTEAGYDFISITDEAGRTTPMSGVINQTFTVSGSSITARFVSDNSVTDSGVTVSILNG